MGGLSKLIAAAACLAALTLFLASCGGGDDSSSGGVAESGSVENGSSEGGGSTGSESSSDSEGSGSGASSGDDSSNGTGEEGSSGDGASDLPDYGEVSSNSASFQESAEHSTLKHLPEFGVEASGGELGEVQSVLDAYLPAYAAQEWAKACEYLNGATRAQAEEFAKQSPESKAGGCGEALRLLNESPLGQGKFPDSTATVSSLRVKEGVDAGFALIHASDGEDYWVAMKGEGGEWKVLSTTPQPFVTPQPSGP